MFWVLNGVVYVVLLFTTGEWQRLIPTSWSIFPDAWQTLLTYLSLHQPPAPADRATRALAAASPHRVR